MSNKSPIAYGRGVELWDVDHADGSESQLLDDLRRVRIIMRVDGDTVLLLSG
jgi:hypothetical protein